MTAAALLATLACGGHSSSASPSPATFTRAVADAVVPLSLSSTATPDDLDAIATAIGTRSIVLLLVTQLSGVDTLRFAGSSAAGFIDLAFTDSLRADVLVSPLSRRLGPRQ